MLCGTVIKMICYPLCMYHIQTENRVFDLHSEHWNNLSSD